MCAEHILTVLGIWYFSSASAIFFICGASLSEPAMMTAQHPLPIPLAAMFPASLNFGSIFVSGNVKVSPVSLSYRDMYLHEVSTIWSSVIDVIGLSSQWPASIRTSLTNCLESSCIFSSGCFDIRSVTSLYWPDVISFAICSDFLYSSTVQNLEESGVFASSIRMILPLSSRPNSYLVSMKTRPFSRASSMPRM